MIAGANGILPLSVPVKKKHGTKSVMKDVQIDYTKPWQKEHWKSITAAYASAPYFEFLFDYYLPLYKKKTKYLLDLNLQALEATLSILNTPLNIRFTDQFSPVPSEGDLRESIHPKKDIQANIPDFRPTRYYQVFEERHGFTANLSILDLVFNEGTQAPDILKTSIKKSRSPI